MTARNILLALSTTTFAVIGLGYLLFPGTMLSIVGISGTTPEAFLIRTEGVALLTAAGLIEAARRGSQTSAVIALWALAWYYVGGSVLDLLAHEEGVVGPASVPSAAIRILIGALCALVAVRDFRRSATATAASGSPPYS